MKTEELIAKVMAQLAEKFKNQLILKGGMLLRLMKSPRATRDLDYAWVRTKKRTLFAQEVKKALEEMEGMKITDIRANPKGVFLTLQDLDGQILNIEIGVVKSMHLPPKPMSTVELAKAYNLKTQVITVMDTAEAFSHKIAASLERNLVRDLYDLAQMEPQTPFDFKTLEDRLSRLEIGRARAQKVPLVEAITLLREKSDRLTQKRTEAELSGVIPDDDLPGLELRIRASVLRVIQRMETLV